MIYGATGSTGRLVAEEATRQGLCPVLTARSWQKLELSAEEIGFPRRSLELHEPGQVRAWLESTGRS